MALLLADENFPMPAVKVLRQLGHDVQTLSETGQAGFPIPDDEVLQLATLQGRCLLTLNRKDFIKLHTLLPSHAGIVICKVDPDFISLAHRVHDCLISQHESIQGQLMRVKRNQP